MHAVPGGAGPVVDGAVVRELQALHVPGLAGAFRALAALTSQPVLSAVSILLRRQAVRR